MYRFAEFVPERISANPAIHPSMAERHSEK